jgi:glycosyltransferase involved in cell wall biosynthesis
MQDGIDVVIVSSFRKTLPDCIKAIENTIPNANIILINGKGKAEKMGYLRKQGIARVTTPIFAFIDDDIIVNKKWYEESIMELSKGNDMVFGRVYPNFGIGLSLCNTEKLKSVSVDEKFDGSILEHLNYKVINVWCEHKNYHLLRRQAFWLSHGFGYGTREAFKHIFNSKDIYQAYTWGFTTIYSAIRNTLRRCLKT